MVAWLILAYWMEVDGHLMLAQWMLGLVWVEMLAQTLAQPLPGASTPGVTASSSRVAPPPG